MKTFTYSRFTSIVAFSILLSGCMTDEESEEGLPVISITNLGNAARVETSDLSINMFGTAVSDEKITSVSWKNDRGGNGIAAGTENWSINRIRLQHGMNHITLTAKDSLGNDNNREITVERNKQGGTTVNSAPSISGAAPATAAVNVSYSFIPSVTDPDGDFMSFSIANKPSWAKFDTSTGRLYGVPRAADAGVHDNIRISVSDGQASATLNSFTVRVEALGVGTATVNWIAPTERSDDTPLTSLAGYEIHYGLTSGNYDNLVTVSNPGITTYVVENLPSGTWEFIVKAFDSEGRISEPSSIGSKTIQ